MKTIKEWWSVIVVILALAVQWGILTQRVNAFDKDRANVAEVRERLAGIEEVLTHNVEDHRRIENELIQVRDLLIKIYRKQ